MSDTSPHAEIVAPPTAAVRRGRAGGGRLLARYRGNTRAQAAASSPIDHALGCLLGLLGLRVSEACNVDVEHLGLQRGHRTLTVIGRGGKTVLVPLPAQSRQSSGSGR